MRYNELELGQGILLTFPLPSPTFIHRQIDFVTRKSRREKCVDVDGKEEINLMMVLK